MWLSEEMYLLNLVLDLVFCFFFLNVIVITWASNETKPLWWEIGGGSLEHIKEIFLDLPDDVMISKC